MAKSQVLRGEEGAGGRRGREGGKERVGRWEGVRSLVSEEPARAAARESLHVQLRGRACTCSCEGEPGKQCA
eukprot:3530184-Rhodomonas_salina.1